MSFESLKQMGIGVAYKAEDCQKSIWDGINEYHQKVFDISESMPYDPPWWDWPRCRMGQFADAFQPPTLPPPSKVARDKVIQGLTVEYFQKYAQPAYSANFMGDSVLSVANPGADLALKQKIAEGCYSTLYGMIYTYLHAGAIGGAIVGLSQLFKSTMNYYTFYAKTFKARAKPYTPPKRRTKR